MIITKFDRDLIDKEEKCVEISLFDKKRGIIIKEEFSLFDNVFIDLNSVDFYKVNQSTKYAQFDDFHLWMDIRSQKIKKSEKVDKYISKQNYKLNTKNRNHERKEEISNLKEKIKKIESEMENEDV